MRKRNLDAPAVVYVVTNSVNGKRYVGVTSKTLSVRMSGHVSAAKRGGKSVFSRAIRKYGQDAFSIAEVMRCVSLRSAFSDEIRMIAKLGPEYNGTKGGDGQLGRVMSEEGKRRISDAHKGNTYRLGKSHSEITKQTLRDIGVTPEARARWAEFSHLGPKAMARKVVCLDDGEEFDSARAAAAHYGVEVSALIEVCLRHPRRKCAGNRVFRYFGDHHGGKDEANKCRADRLANRQKRPMSMMKPVLCVTDGKTFSGAKEAAEVYGVSRYSINEVCRGEKPAVRGFKFEYLGRESAAA